MSAFVALFCLVGSEFLLVSRVEGGIWESGRKVVTSPDGVLFYGLANFGYQIIKPKGVKDAERWHFLTDKH